MLYLFLLAVVALFSCQGCFGGRQDHVGYRQYHCWWECQVSYGLGLGWQSYSYELRFSTMFSVAYLCGHWCIDAGPIPAIAVAPTPCKSHPPATPVISVNTPVLRWSSVTPGQVPPVTRVNDQKCHHFKLQKHQLPGKSHLLLTPRLTLMSTTIASKEWIAPSYCYLLLFKNL